MHSLIWWALAVGEPTAAAAAYTALRWMRRSRR
jgi:hypothetical protein